MQVSQFIRETRQSLDLSQKEFAEHLNICLSNMRKIESGEMLPKFNHVAYCVEASGRNILIHKQGTTIVVDYADGQQPVTTQQPTRPQPVAKPEGGHKCKKVCKLNNDQVESIGREFFTEDGHIDWIRFGEYYDDEGHEYRELAELTGIPLQIVRVKFETGRSTDEGHSNLLDWLALYMVWKGVFPTQEALQAYIKM